MKRDEMRKPRTKKHNAKISAAMLGKAKTVEHKAAISASRQAIYGSKEWQRCYDNRLQQLLIAAELSGIDPVRAASLETFWSHIKIIPLTGCWEWSGPWWSNGYGLVRRGRRNEGAHRVAWELTHGQEIPEGMLVLHSCDNPPCIYPGHLRIGTNQDNMNDAKERGRYRRSA